MKKMSSRILRAIMFSVVVAIIASIIIIIGFSYNYYLDTDLANLKTAAEFAAAGVEENDVKYLESLDDPNVRVTYVDSDGDVIYDSSADYTDMENHADREEINEAFELGRGQSYPLF